MPYLYALYVCLYVFLLYVRLICMPSADRAQRMHVTQQIRHTERERARARERERKRERMLESESRLVSHGQSRPCPWGSLSRETVLERECFLIIDDLIATFDLCAAGTLAFRVAC